MSWTGGVLWNNRLMLSPLWGNIIIVLSSCRHFQQGLVRKHSITNIYTCGVQCPRPQKVRAPNVCSLWDEIPFVRFGGFGGLKLEPDHFCHLQLTGLYICRLYNGERKEEEKKSGCVFDGTRIKPRLTPHKSRSTRRWEAVENRMTPDAWCRVGCWMELGMRDWRACFNQKKRENHDWKTNLHTSYMSRSSSISSNM